jgi:hypothetical protein
MPPACLTRWCVLIDLGAGTGYVGIDDFFRLMSNFGRRQLPESLVARIVKVLERTGR